MNLQIAHKLSEGEEREAREKRRWQRFVEIVEVVILAIVAVATAWSGYQAAKWDGHQAFLYGTSSRIRFEADAAATLGQDQKLQDITTFNTWIQAHQRGDEQLADLYVRRFSPEYRIAFDAWLETRPFSDPDAPPGPSFMPEYHNPETERAVALNERASTMFEAGTAARETADRYVRLTVLLATVLFLVAVGQRFTFRGVRIAASVMAGVLMIVAVFGVISLPRL
jgi:hypothetical protein